MQKVAIVGAGGKMGQGIAQLFLCDLAMEPQGRRLVLVDANEDGLLSLKKTLRKSLTAFGEKQINRLRQMYADREDLVSNREIIADFVESGLDRVTAGCTLEEIHGSSLVIEAIVEEPEAKVALFQQARALVHPNALFLSNTSSIPIHQLATQSGLEGRLLGFHFYNPPPIQKLVEVVASDALFPEAQELASRLGKIVIRSADIPGFIGNGHFIREVAVAWDLAQTHGFELIEKVTGNLLVRPMGIFSLVKYVGVDVCKHIAEIMGHELIRPLVIPDSLPKTGSTWKGWNQLPNLKDKVDTHFNALRQTDTLEAQIALDFLSTSSSIASQLVSDGVANSLDDVGIVLKEGFHHLYLPWEVV